MKVPESNSKEYAIPDAGVHSARLIWLIDLGTQEPTNPAYYPARKLKLGFELVDTEAEFDGEKKPLMVSTEVSFSHNEKSKLHEIVKAWTGIVLSKDKDFDLSSLLGKEALVTVVHNQSSDGRVYANIAGVSGVPKGFPVKEPKNLLTGLSLADGEFSEKIFASLPEKIREKIQKSPEYKMAISGPF